MLYTVKNPEGKTVYRGTNQAKAIAAREFCKGTMTACFIGPEVRIKETA